MDFEIKDKVVLLTGGAIGIGAKVIEYFLDEGVKHVSFLDVLEKEGAILEKKLNDKYGSKKVAFILCDITNSEQLSDAYKTILEAHDYIDIIVNNAGIMNDSLATFRKQIDVNVTALISNSLKAIELMRKDKGGRGGVIINASSIAALNLNHLMPVYNATKAAVLNFSSSIGLPAFYSRTGVRVITVCFGATNTSLISKEKFAAVDEVVTSHLDAFLDRARVQKVESGARAVIDACKIGESGSTWLSIYDKPAMDITKIIKTGYGTFAQVLSRNYSKL